MPDVTVGPGKQYATISEGITAAEEGFTVSIYDDTYSVTSRIQPLAGQTITAADGETSVIVDGSGITTSVGVFDWTSRDQITIRGIRIKGTSSTVSVCKGGIYIVTSDDCVIDDCEIWSFYLDGIRSVGCSNLTIKNCDIYDNGHKDEHYHGIYLGTDTDDAIVENCTFRSNGANGGMALHCNTGSGSDDNPPDTYTNDRIKIYSNVFNRNGTNGYGQGMDLMNSHDCEVYNNVFIDNWIKCLSNVYDTGDNRWQHFSDRNLIVNNTFVRPNGSIAIKFFGPADGLYDGGRNCLAFNNICITSDAAAAITDNQTAVGYLNTVTNNYEAKYTTTLMDTIFDPSSGGWRNDNFKLTEATIPLILRNGIRFAVDTLGTTKYAPTTDYYGGTRPIPNPGGTWDIGAHQYASGTGEEWKWPYWCVSTRDVGIATGWTLEGAALIGTAVNGDPTVDPDAVYATSDSTSNTFTVGLAPWPPNWPQSPTAGGTRKRFPKEE